MDFSILFRVIWSPSDVFKQFKEKLRLEPYIFIGILAIFQGLMPYLGRFGEISQSGFAVTMNVLVGYLFFLAFPIVNVLVVTLAITFLGGERPSFFSILSALILCHLPYYIEAILALTLGYSPIGLGSLFPSIEHVSPFAFGMIGTISLSFGLCMALWWFAINQLLSLSEKKKLFVVAILAFANIFLGGWIWRMTSIATK